MDHSLIMVKGLVKTSDETYMVYGLLQKETATHSSIPAWRIPGTEEPGGLPSMGLHGIRHDWNDLACMHACIGEGNGNPLQCSGLENPRDRGAWWAAVCGVAQSQTQLLRLSSSSSNQYSCRDNTMNSLKRQTHMTLEDEPPRSGSVQHATEEEW